MRHFLWIFLILPFLAAPSFAQPTARQFSYVSTDPAGSCANGTANQYNYILGKEWGCKAGTWTLLASGGGGGASPAGSAVTDAQCWASASTLGVCANVIITGKYTGSAFTTGGTPPALTPGTGGAIGYSEGTVPSVGAAAATDVVYADATQHGFLASFNNGAYLPLIQGPASATSGHVATFNGTNGGLLQDGGVLPTVTGGTCINQAVTAISGSAVPTCTTLTSAYVNNSIALTGTDINTSNQITATHLATALPGAQGGTGVVNAGFTLTLAGNVTFTGAFNPTFSIPASNTWTLPNATTTLVGGGAALTTTGCVPFETSSGILTCDSAFVYNASATVGSLALGQHQAGGNSVITGSGSSIYLLPLGGGGPDGLRIAQNGGTELQAVGGANGLTAVTQMSLASRNGGDLTNLVFKSTNVQFDGKVNLYQNLSTVGPGLAPIYGRVSSTANAAAITTATLCAAAVCTGGQYIAHVYLASTVTCGTPGTASVSINLTWTDDAGTKTTQTIPLDANGGLTLASTMPLGDTTSYGSGTLAIFSSGANPIQYATVYTACGVGTGTYSLRLSLEQLT